MKCSWLFAGYWLLHGVNLALFLLALLSSSGLRQSRSCSALTSNDVLEARMGKWVSEIPVPGLSARR